MASSQVDQNLHIYFGDDEIPRLSGNGRKRSFVALLRGIIATSIIEILLGFTLCLLGITEIFAQATDDLAWDRIATGILASVTGGLAISAARARSDYFGHILFTSEVVLAVIMSSCALGSFIWCCIRVHLYYQASHEGQLPADQAFVSRTVSAAVGHLSLFLLGLFSVFAGLSNVLFLKKLGIVKTAL